MVDIILRETSEEIRESFAQHLDLLEDRDPDRFYQFETAVFRYILYTTTGTPVDPYSAPEIVRGVDGILREYLPVRTWPKHADALRLTADFVGRQVFYGGGVVVNVATVFFNTREENPERSQERHEGIASAAIARMLGRLQPARKNGILHLHACPFPSVLATRNKPKRDQG